MKESKIQSISDVLNIFFEKNPQLSRKLAETRLMNSWEKVLNPAVLRYTGQLFVKNNCLYVEIKSSIVKSELIMQRERLIQDLNREAGEAVITNINFL
jgi:hypothetical protein